MLRIPLVFGAALVVTACSSSTDATLEACVRFLHAVDVSCTNRSSEVMQSNIDARAPAACKRSLAAPGVTTTAADLDKCSAILEKAACETISSLPEECQTKPGSRANDAPCGSDAQCKSTFCKIDRASNPSNQGSFGFACGTCAAPVAENASCSGGGDRCVTGYECLSGKCLKVVKSDIDGPCGNQTAQCKDNLLCDNLTRTCVARKPVGVDCLGTFECEAPFACVANKCGTRVGEGGACSSDECELALHCDGDSGTCVKFEYAKAGATCGKNVLCDPLGTSCPDSGTCPLVVGDGEACDVASAGARVCNFYATCRDGKCVLDDPSTCK